MVDRYDPKSGMSSMMRTTAFPASIVLQMMCAGTVSKRGAILQERDIPADAFLAEVARRGIRIEHSME
jgi:saccharopine dehydrogenase-like NADP-dependent oxidoreductase